MAVNLKFPLKRGAAGAFETNDTTIDAVADDLRILLLTNHGERPIHYDFGANIRALLFEQQGPDFSIMAEDNIVTAIDKWMPFVTVRSVTVQTSADTAQLKTNEVHIKIEFLVGQEEGLLEQRIAI
jgi:phage baseplate assembly protein W